MEHAEEEKAGLPASRHGGAISEVSQQVGQYDGASVIMQHRAAHGWSCGPVTPVALWASGCHCPSCTSGLLGARGVPNGSVARKLISALPLQLLWGSPACTPGVPSWFVESLRTSVEY